MNTITTNDIAPARGTSMSDIRIVRDYPRRPDRPADVVSHAMDYC